MLVKTIINLKFETAPIKNNFIGEKLYDNTEPSGTSATDSANNMNKPLDNKFRKCMSLYDVSNDLAFQLSTKSVNTVPCDKNPQQNLLQKCVQSTTKSKDSRFQRSLSCSSLTSGKRNYDHVQSKEKEYINNIKKSEAFQKKNKPFQKDYEMVVQKTVVDEVESVMDKEELLMKIQDLKRDLHEKAMKMQDLKRDLHEKAMKMQDLKRDLHEKAMKIQDLKRDLHEKALLIETQQRNNNSLLLKLAEAKNTIDSLRLQKLSSNYSSTNESQNFSSRFDSFDFEKEMDRKGKQPNSSKNMVAKISKCENPTQEQSSISLETSNSSITKPFRPTNHSIPDKNEPSTRLSPVSKIFCSSSQLDKHYKPLTNVRKPSCTFSQSLCNLNGHSQSCQCCLRKKKVSTSEVPISCKSRQSALKPNVNSPGKEKHPHICIDLPNIHPFVEAQEWQASIPSSNLLMTQSSSDFEASDLGVSQSSVLGKKSDKVGKIASPVTQNTEEVIDCLLSQESDDKCTISLVEVDSTLDIKTTLESNHLSFISYRQSKNDVGHTPSSPPRKSKRRSPTNSFGTSTKLIELSRNKKRTNFVLQKPKLNISVPLKNVAEVRNPMTSLNSNFSKNVNTSMKTSLIAESSQRKAWNARNGENFYVFKDDFYIKKSNSSQE